MLAGVSGDPDLQKLYLKEISDLRSMLENSYGFPRDHITVLFDDPSKAPDLIQYKSNSESLREACRKLSARVKKNDLMLVFIEGHGDYDGKVYRLNLVGPDPTAEELAAILSWLVEFDTGIKTGKVEQNRRSLQTLSYRIVRARQVLAEGAGTA